MKGIIKFSLFIASIVLTVLSIMGYFGGNVGGYILADVVVGGMYTDDMAIFRRGLAKKMEKETWLYSKWSKLTSMIDVKKFKETGTYAGAMNLKPSGNVIDVVKDFEREGGLYMDVPVLSPLTDQGVVGAEPLRGREETRKYVMKSVAINQLRHAVKIQDNKVSKQTLKKPQFVASLMERGTADLQDWFTRKLGFQPYFAIFKGYSDNLTDPVYGVNKSQKSHPNFYVRGFGKATFANVFDATYETNAATALASLTGTSDEYFGSQAIKDMVYLATKHRIPKVNVGGTLCYLIFIHSAQMRQLRNDAAWIDAMKYNATRGDGNQIFTGVSEGILYEGACLIVDDTIPAARISGDDGYDAARGTINYGVATYMKDPRDTSPRKAAILVGGQALMAGYGSELGFESETADYGQFLGDAADMIIGFERSDLIDTEGYYGTAGNFYGNHGSLVFWTYSPDDIETSI